MQPDRERVEFVIARAAPRTSPIQDDGKSIPILLQMDRGPEPAFTIVAPRQPRREAASPLKRKPRKKISSKIGTAITIASQKTHCEKRWHASPA